MERKTMDNLSLWNRFEKTDPKYTKSFQRSGGFSGTAINPMYSAKRMTEAFGPCGVGWGSEEIAHRIEEGADGVKIWFAKVRVWYLHNGEKAYVEQWGATEFVGKRKSGMYTDEEAAKKSYTDAETKCFSKIGLGADIYLGTFDGCKWVNTPEEAAPAVKEESAFEKAKKVIPKMKDLDHAKKLGASIQTRFAEGGIDLAQACQLCILWVPFANELAKDTTQVYEVMGILEQFNNCGMLSPETLAKLSSSCTKRLKEFA
jgi:hypothetical protein